MAHLPATVFVQVCRETMTRMGRCMPDARRKQPLAPWRIPMEMILLIVVVVLCSVAVAIGVAVAVIGENDRDRFSEPQPLV